jgi:hypothetical protein
MLNPFKMFNRLAWLAILLFGGGTAVMVAIVVLATGGLGSRDLINLPKELRQTPTSNQTQPLPEPEVRLDEVVQKRPALENVPFPSEVSTDPEVVGTNATLAIILAIIFGIVSNTLNNLLRDNEETIRGWFRVPILGPFFRMFGWGASQGVQRGCLTLPIIVLIFALYGIIFAFLEGGLNILTPEGMQLALVMAMSVGLISLAGDVAQRQVARFWRGAAHYGVYPANLFLAVVTTVFSRVTHISPGVVFGVPGGVDVEKDESHFHDVILAIATIVVITLLGGAGWAASAAVHNMGDRTMTVDQAEFSGPLVQLGLTISLALFLVAIETGFFEMVPLGSSLGRKIFGWNFLVWGVLFTPIMFLFTHTLLNPHSTYLDAFEHTNVQVLLAMIVILSIITAILWFYFRMAQPTPEPAQMPYYPPQPGYYQPPQQQPYQPGYPPQQPPRAPQQPQQVYSQPPRTPPPSTTPPAPPSSGYTPPPIIISDEVPPPIVIRDEPTEKRKKPGSDENQRRT